MKKKRNGIILLFLILVSLLSFSMVFHVVNAQAQTAYNEVNLVVDSFTNTTVEWTETGSSPYLDTDDDDTSMISNAAGNNTHSYFTFDNLDTIVPNTFLWIRLYYTTEVSSGTYDIYIYNGSWIYVAEQSITSGWELEYIDVSSHIRSFSEINNARLLFTNTTGTPDTAHVSYAYLRVRYQIDVEWWNNCENPGQWTGSGYVNNTLFREGLASIRFIGDGALAITSGINITEHDRIGYWIYIVERTSPYSIVHIDINTTSGGYCKLQMDNSAGEMRGTMSYNTGIDWYTFFYTSFPTDQWVWMEHFMSYNIYVANQTTFSTRRNGVAWGGTVDLDGDVGNYSAFKKTGTYGANFEMYFDYIRITDMWEYLPTNMTSISVTAGLENIDADADWVFTNWKYYEFTAYVNDIGLDNVSIYFVIPTSFEIIACYFSSNGTDWTYSSNMTYESRYGEPVLLRAGTWEENTGTTVTFNIWFQEHVLDVWRPDQAIDVYGAWDGNDYIVAGAQLFRIYSNGGFTLNTASSNSTYAYIITGGTPFSFHVQDDGGIEDQWMYNEIWFRDVQHLKLLPEIHFITGRDSFDVFYGVDYNFGDGIWNRGWFMDIQPHTIHYNGLFAAEVWINMTARFRDRFGTVSREDLYMYPHGAITQVGSLGYWEYWMDLWISSKNASTVGAARVNAYEHPMKDGADPWLRWLSNNWAPMDNIYKEFEGEVPILDNDNTTIRSSEEVVMWRFWSQVRVFSAGGGQVIEVRNFDHFDETKSAELPLTGIGAPVFEETATPVVGNKGLLGALYTMFSMIGSFISENILFGGLNLWGAFVGFLDSIAAMFGAPRFFTNLFNFIGDLLRYLISSISYIGTVLIQIFQLIGMALASFLTTMGELIGSVVNSVTMFLDMMGGAYGAGANLWDTLGISTWITVALVFYSLWLVILWDEQGMDAVINHLSFVFGILSWIFNFMISLILFIIRIITSVIESIPIAE